MRILKPKAPFDWAKTLRFISGFSPSQDDQEITHRTLTKAVRINGSTVVFRVSSSETPKRPRLEVELFADREISKKLEGAALERISFYLSLDDDLSLFYALAQDDPPFLNVIERLYGYHQVKFLTPWENAAWAILTQRTSGPVARTYKRRLTEHFGGVLETPYGTFRAFLQPADLLRAKAGEIARLTGGFRRDEFLLSAAQAFTTANETWLRTAPYDEAFKWLRQIKGIGEWSAAFVLLRGLGRMERAILEDAKNPYVVSVLEAAQKVYGPITLGEVREKARHYGNWQGYWAHYLRVLD
ncbi:MAG TPA: hypothetical protein VFS50_10085 [Meiothermus sp.]|nr:hypothetical protein [Meiothermus sp.]